jgi:nucleoside phosphorylase
MEDAAVSQVCWMLGVPVIIVRGISDNPVLAIDYSQENVNRAAKKAAEFVIDIIQSLN